MGFGDPEAAELADNFGEPETPGLSVGFVEPETPKLADDFGESETPELSGDLEDPEATGLADGFNVCVGVGVSSAADTDPEDDAAAITVVGACIAEASHPAAVKAAAASIAPHNRVLPILFAATRTSASQCIMSVVSILTV